MGGCTSTTSCRRTRGVILTSAGGKPTTSPFSRDPKGSAPLRVAAKRGGAPALRRRVIVDDAPLPVDLAEDEREQPLGGVLLQRQQEPAAHDRVVGAEHLHVQVLEGEFAHLAALALVGFLVACQGRVPAA